MIQKILYLPSGFGFEHTMMGTHLVSVLMSVYDGERYCAPLGLHRVSATAQYGFAEVIQPCLPFLEM